jgi:hypothetical protein
VTRSVVDLRASTRRLFAITGLLATLGIGTVADAQVAATTDGIARWFCAATDSTHPKRITVLQPITVVPPDLNGTHSFLLAYEPDEGGPSSRGEVTATVRLRKGGEGKAAKLLVIKGQQNTGNGAALAIGTKAAELAIGDVIEWQLRFKKMARMSAGACFTAIVATTPPDADCGPYPDAAESAYVLPYASGSGYVVTQANCFIGSHRDTAAHAYDLGMPIGTGIVAMRAGAVVHVVDDNPDAPPGSVTGMGDNVVRIEHADGTFASYVHLAQGSALVAVGDVVEQGQPIGMSGNSGSTSGIPHVHIQLTPCLDRRICGTLPLTFRNTSKHPNGLALGSEYVAR